MPPKPTTFLGYVEHAIRELKDAGGSSRQAIAKHIKVRSPLCGGVCRSLQLTALNCAADEPLYM